MYIYMYGQIRIVPVHQPETMSFWNSYPILNIIPSDDAARSFIHTQYQYQYNIYIYTCVYIYIYYILRGIHVYIYMCGMSPSNTVVNHFPFTGPSTSRALCPGLMRPESRQLCSIVSAYQLNT